LLENLPVVMNSDDRAPVESKDQSAFPIRYVILLLLGVLALYFIGLGEMSLWDTDEPLYGQIAREMTRSDDPITPVFRGANWFCHPPLYFWLAGLAGRMLGWSEFSLRFWPALFGVGGVLLVALWGGRLWNRSSGVWSAVILATSLEYFILSHMALLDSIFIFFLTASLYCFYQGYVKSDRKLYFWGLVASGMATLAKGLFGLVYPFMIFIPFLLLRRELGKLRDIPWLSGGLAALAIGASWFVIESIRFGSKFIDTVLGYFTISRIFIPVMDHKGPVYFYLAIIVLGFFPWIGLLPRALGDAWRNRRRPEFLWLLVWTIVTLVFFSIAQTKLPNYILTIFPALALMVAYSWSQAIPSSPAPGRKSWNWALGGVIATLAFLLTAILWLGFSRYPQYVHAFIRPILIFLGTPLLGCILALVAANSSVGAKPGPMTILAITAVVFNLVLILVVLPCTESFKASRPLARVLKPTLQATESLMIYRIPDEFSLNYYTDHEVFRLREPEQVVELLGEPERVFIVVPRVELAALQSGGAPLFVWEGWARALLISNRPPPARVP